jgi:hypothetical protein
MSKNPWIKFYPTDWLAESKLKTISRAARSLWFDMLCLMHQTGNGRLEINGRPMTEKELAQILGDNPRTIKTLLSEIELAGVSSRIEGDFIASRRLIQDRIKAELDTLNGRMGGNPSLQNNSLDKNGVNPEVKAQKPEARSQKPEDTPIAPKGDPEQIAVDAWNEMAGETGLSKVQLLTVTRRKKVALRLSECGGLPGWTELLLTVRKSPHLLGKTAGKGGEGPWRANFDWILEPRNFTKVMEGNYVRHEKPTDPRPPGGRGFFESILADD